MKDNVYVVILVGGQGKRLKPLSTAAKPKAFLSITADRKTLLQNTINRIRSLVRPSNIIVVANRRHYRLVRKSLPRLSAKNIILEPVSRNTAPAIALAGRHIQKKRPDSVIAVLPTDHYIRDDKRYRASLKKGIAIAGKGESSFVVFGIKPKRPDTGYGYLKIEEGDIGKSSIYKVERFVEKPTFSTARRFVASRRYFWNSGTFVFRIDKLMDAFESIAPEIFGIIKGGGSISSSYRNMPNISIDYALMQKIKGISCIKLASDWNDVGSFDSLKCALRQEKRGFIEKGGKVVKIL